MNLGCTAMNTTRRAALAVFCAAWLSSAGASARGEDADKPKGGPLELQGLKFRLLGPNAGGRVSRAAGVPGDPLTYYAATASGGVWKSVDGGTRWAPIFDDQPIASIGSIAVAPSNPNVVYVGSGEANIRGNVAPGNGIYKSTDGGKTWAHVWKQEGQIGTMIVHPQNPDVAFAAVLGHAFGPNPERGVYRTRDGGKTWQKVLAKNSDTGASDVCFDPQNPEHPLRRALAGASPPLGAHERRSGQRPLHVARRRRYLEAPRGQRPARRHPGQDRGGGGALRSATGVRAHRSREGRPLPLRRRGREAGAASTTTTRSRSGPGTTRPSPSIPRTPTWSGSRRCRCSRRSTAARP